MAHGVYYVRYVDFPNELKIGKWSGSDPWGTLRYFKRASSREVELLATEQTTDDRAAYALEQLRQRQFRHLRIPNRREWFYFEDDLASFVANLSDGGFNAPIYKMVGIVQEEPLTLGKPDKWSPQVLSKEPTPEALGKLTKPILTGLSMPPLEHEFYPDSDCLDETCR